VTPSVSVVIPSVRGGEKLVELVRSLRADRPDAELLVADNGLAPETAASLRAAGATVLELGGNVGFGAAVNRAARAATGDVLVTVNDDACPEPGFVDALVEPLGNGTVMAAGVLLRAECPELVETAGIVLDAALGSHDYLHNEPVSRLDEALPPPVGPCGGAAAYRRDEFLAAGGFDEALFAYGEDVDLALRLRARGGACALATGARALHEGSGTLGYQSLEKAKLVGFSRGYLMRKYGVLHRPGPAVHALGAELAASAVLGVRHRSLEPALSRLRGWRACRTRAPLPTTGAPVVGTLEGLRGRYARSNRLRT
jgi:N-acetylglucosaminyl-diphospho-decaprenol L-rhamnosyltransferase